ncbi:hypothetical protein MESS4_560108 [Mesorhizobium sp. STM 4661]|nr:hypothetical protein MESS4_560108 [Mesorhizobium sp. STM 4661]
MPCRRSRRTTSKNPGCAVDTQWACRHKALRWFRRRHNSGPNWLECLVAWLRRQTGEVPEWLKGTDCKSVSLAYVGSNPTLSTTAGPEALKREKHRTESAWRFSGESGTSVQGAGIAQW